ncbi:hypothetical protein CRG98_028497 [Punica granatum]|uniref:Uncharacterized protein n=1 Tax=Punica granatum TaxID=22663 RepID=A0A2I0J4F1_PUNGR|nr:hypothetical protein CRG98_028497 [Punica granatum]
MHVESCGLFSLKPSTVIVPCSMKEDVDRLFTGHREMDGSDLKKLKQDYAGLSGCGIWDLRLAGVEVTNTIMVPEIAFTGDNMSKFIVDSDNVDVLRAKILILESTFNNDTMTIEDAREYGHTHLLESTRFWDKERERERAVLARIEGHHRSKFLSLESDEIIVNGGSIADPHWHKGGHR